MGLHPALLRPDHHEIEQRQDQQQRRDLDQILIKRGALAAPAACANASVTKNMPSPWRPIPHERRLAGRGGADYRAEPRLCNRARDGWKTTVPMSSNPSAPDLSEAHLARIAAALERIAPPPPGPADLSSAEAFVWRPTAGGLKPVAKPERVPLDLARCRWTLSSAPTATGRHSLKYAALRLGRAGNNALLWGARGTGKSALIKATHAELAKTQKNLKLVEVAREDLPRLADLLTALQGADARSILFIDDLSFDGEDDGLRH